MNNAERRAIPISERLEAHSIPEPNSGCLLWFGALGGSGHGRMKVAGKWEGAHRIAWEEKNGPIPAGLWVLHKCDVHCCINTDHHFLGDHDDNMADMVAKRRSKSPPLGEANYSAKLTEEMVRQIIDRPDVPARQFARLFNVAHSTVDHVRSGRHWSHMTEGEPQP